MKLNRYVLSFIVNEPIIFLTFLQNCELSCKCGKTVSEENYWKNILKFQNHRKLSV